VFDTMEPEAEAGLLARARAGSHEALGDLLDHAAGRLLALIRLRLGAKLRAELESRDVLQATLLKAVSGFDRFEGDGVAAFTAWLARIAQNEIRDQADFHGRQRRDAALRVSLDGQPEIERLAARVRSQTSRIALNEELARLERMLETLAPEQREVIILRRLEELSFAEIGERLGRSPDASRMLFARAMTALTLAMENVP
jgi:RNA polymerase sigma-70 factor (ECF subfamily)